MARRDSRDGEKRVEDRGDRGWQKARRSNDEGLCTMYSTYVEKKQTHSYASMGPEEQCLSTQQESVRLLMNLTNIAPRLIFVIEIH